MADPLILDGRVVASAIRARLKEQVGRLPHGLRPGLAAVLVGGDPASAIYVGSKEKACKEVGFFSLVEAYPDSIAQEELLQVVHRLNADRRINGILVQMPLPKHINEQEIVNAILPGKDVDGFHPVNMGNLLLGYPAFFPCTPAGILEVLSYYNISVAGKHVVVVGRSNIVGKPVAGMLLQKREGANAIVTVAHTAAPDIAQFTRQADILIAAVGKPGVITAPMVKPGVVVIDVGINRVPAPGSPKGYKVTGDVDYASVAPVAAAITPVPGGIGPMTIAMLLQNTYNAFKKAENL